MVAPDRSLWSATECFLEGLEVLRLHAPRSDERIDFGRQSGYERCTPAALTDPVGAGERPTVNGPLESLEVPSIHPSASQQRVDVGLDGPSSRARNIRGFAPNVAEDLQRVYCQ